MAKTTLIKVIKEEIIKVIGENQLSSKDITDIVDRLIKKLDSIDLSLDLIYGALSGAEPLVTRRKQATFGRLTRAMPQREEVPRRAASPIATSKK